MDKTRLCKKCGIEIPFIKYRPRCYTCYEVFNQKRVCSFKLERDHDRDEEDPEKDLERNRNNIPTSS